MVLVMLARKIGSSSVCRLADWPPELAPPELVPLDTLLEPPPVPLLV
jgi:hypothetical protein